MSAEEAAFADKRRPIPTWDSSVRRWRNIRARVPACAHGSGAHFGQVMVGRARRALSFFSEDAGVLASALESVMLERRGNQIHFHPRLIELSGQYFFSARPLPSKSWKSERAGGAGNPLCT